MRVRICKEVEIDTEVSVDIDDIQSAIAESLAYAKENQQSFSVSQFVSACWESLNSLTDEQIELVKPTTCVCIAAGLRDLAVRFERHVVPVAPIVTSGPAEKPAHPAKSEQSAVKWQAVWQQKPHDSHSRMIHEFTASDDRDQAMDVAHLEIQRDYCCVTFTIHTLERLT